MKPRYLVLLICVALFVVWVINVRQENKKKIAEYNQQIAQFEKQHKANVDECIKHGIQEYKEMEAYPRLTTTGELAIDVITKACNYNDDIYHSSVK
jgi:rubrerythrin